MTDNKPNPSAPEQEHRRQVDDYKHQRELIHSRGDMDDAVASERRRLKLLYERIFTIRSTGDPKHPVQGTIDDDAKAAFEEALESKTVCLHPARRRVSPVQTQEEERRKPRPC